MKHPELRMSLEAVLPSSDSVHSWLGHQLEVRGIDSIVYTRYIISLLQHDYSDQLEAEELWGKKVEQVKKRDRKGEHKKRSPVSEEERRKNAVLECLQSVSDQDCDIENLVDELCHRLKDIKTHKECCAPLSVNVNTVQEKKETKNCHVTCTQDPAQRYYAAFPALSGEDSPASISPSVCETSVWKRNPLTVGKTAGETSESKDKLSTEDGKTTSRNTSTKSEMDLHTEKIPPKRRSKSMTDGKETERRAKKLDCKKKVYPKGNKIRTPQPKVQKVLEKHDKTSVHLMSGPLTTRVDFNEVCKDERDKAADAEYCSKVEQIIKTLLLSGISDQPRKSGCTSSDAELPEWMREESVSPELQENYEWYTQPLNEILVTPFSRSKRLYKRHSYPPTIFFEEETDLESILGPLLSSVTSRYKFVDDVFSPPIDEADLNMKEDEVFESRMPDVLKENILPHVKNNEEKDRSQQNPVGYKPTYTDTSNLQVCLFESVDNKENQVPNFQEHVFEEKAKKTQMCESWHGVIKGDLKNEDTSNSELYNVWQSEAGVGSEEKPKETCMHESWHGVIEGGLKNEEMNNSELYNAWQSEGGVGLDTSSIADLYDVSSCSTQTFDSDDGTDMSDFEGIFTFDLESDEDCMCTPVDYCQKPPTCEILGPEYKEGWIEPTIDTDVSDNRFYTDELLRSFNSVIESPKNTGVCSMLIDREYLTEIMQMDLQSKMDMNSPYTCTNVSPLCFNIWSIDERNTESCWQNKVLLHEFLQTFDDDCRITSVPWDTFLGDSKLRWNLTPKDECEKLREKTKSGQLSQLWDVNSQKKVPWFGAFWNMPYNFGIWTSFSESGKDDQITESEWTRCTEHVEWDVKETEFFLSQGTIEEDAIIGVELLEELHKESSKEDIRRNLCVSSWDRNERSVSDSNIHNSWSKRDPGKPEFHRSFDLIPSETSAFTDVIPGKMPHVRSVPNLKFTSLFSLPPSDVSANLSSSASSSGNHDSPVEHLYFSNRTHFRPIQTPVGTPHEDKLENRGDLFGDLGISSGTPYQQFHEPGAVEEKLPMFRPKFKVQKDMDKYIQTGRSLDDDYEPKSRSETNTYQSSTYIESGNSGGIFDVNADDSCGKESGFESNGELDESGFLSNDKGMEHDILDWTDESVLTSRFSRLYMNNTDHSLPALADIWQERKSDIQSSEYSNAWSSGYDCEEVEGGNFGSYMQCLQYLPLVKHGELSFSHHSEKDSVYGCDIYEESKERPSLLESRLDKQESVPGESSGYACGKGDVFRSPGYKTDDGAYVWKDENTRTTSNIDEPFRSVAYETKCLENSDYRVDSIPNSVDELSQYYPGTVLQDIKRGRRPARTHELLHTHGFDVNVVQPVPIPDTAVYSCELEQQDIGGSVAAPMLPDVAVYSSDLEKQWLDPESLPKSEWPAYQVMPDPQMKNKKIKTKAVSRKPCSFFLEGSCKRSDCKFSHDISTITCRFWEDGMCFKGPLCPFLHGYHFASDSDTNSVDSVEVKFELKKEEFPELKIRHQGSGKFLECEDKARKHEKARDRKKKIISTKIHKV